MRNCVSRPTFPGLALKLIDKAGKTCRRINCPEKIKLLLEGIPPSRTANRLKAFDRVSRNPPLEIDDHRATRTPLPTLTQ